MRGVSSFFKPLGGLSVAGIVAASTVSCAVLSFYSPNISFNAQSHRRSAQELKCDTVPLRRLCEVVRGMPVLP